MEARLFDKSLNPNKLLKEQFVSNLTGSSISEIAALSTIVPVTDSTLLPIFLYAQTWGWDLTSFFILVRRHWWFSGSGAAERTMLPLFHHGLNNTRRDAAKKNDDKVLRVRKDWIQYFSTLLVDYLTVILPVLLVFTLEPKKKQKKASSSNTVTSIVVATPGSGMVFPHNEAVASATQQPKRVKKAAKKKGPPPTSTSRSATGSNDPFPVQIENPLAVHQDIVSYEVSPQRKKQAVMKKCTPKRAPVEVANPSSPASNTRSKKKLLLM